ncbi:rhamnose-binding lectin [Astyanax mexicanus]|uniref:rhamnose-binding lectin n=1 Tax=Astyanax mexicanus TaxID=7994 RepID=UPI0020CAAF42|nr:rhamnose-binding lectin [Astyanax mexicanus]
MATTLNSWSASDVETSTSTMFFLKLSLLICLIQVPGLVTSTENVITCNGLVQRLNCDIGLIKVKSALYGRTDSAVCSAGRSPSEIQDTKCSMSIPEISERCDGQTACELRPDLLGVTDPCPKTYKYLNTTYNCLEARVSMICEGSYSTLNCGNHVIQIVSADYGRTDRTICSEGLTNNLTENTNCHSPDTVTSVVERCNDRRRCTLEASNAIFTDPCFGTYKYLAVSYFCLPRDIETSVTCEHSTAVLKCGAGVLKIHSANYGRTDSITCSAGRPVHEIIKSDCFASNTLAEVVKRCEGKNSCAVPATNSVFSDPCVGTFKYLSVEYSCVSNDGIKFSLLTNKVE